MNTIFIVFWGLMSIVMTIFAIFVIIKYAINRYSDKKKQKDGIYIRRVNWIEASLVIFTPGASIISYFASTYRSEVNLETNLLYEFMGIFISALFVAISRYILIAYVKLSPEGIEQRVWSANPTRYPINAIDSIVYYETLNVEDQDMVGFYTKSGKQIAAFGPTTHNNYRILAIVRFRIENERWPDMDNPGDVAQVDELDERGMTISYFRDLEKVTGLADVDM